MKGDRPRKIKILLFKKIRIFRFILYNRNRRKGWFCYDQFDEKRDGSYADFLEVG